MKRKISTGSAAFDLANGLFMAAIFVLMAYPFLYVVNYSFSSSRQTVGALMLWPRGFNLDSYRLLFKDASIYRAMLVSISRSMLGPTLMMAVTGMAAFALSRKNLVFGRFFRLYFFLTMYFSAGLIPTYLLMKFYRLTGTYWIYILPSLVSPFNIVLVKTYIESIPASLEEAVFIDGGNEFQCYWHVLFAVCLPVNAAIVLFSVIGHWNAYIDTQLYNAMDRDLFTLQYVLYNILAANTQQTLEEAKRQAASNLSPVNTQTVKMAITVVTVVPVAMVYPLLQKYFATGIMVGSIKA